MIKESTILQLHKTSESMFKEHKTFRLVLLKHRIEILGWKPGWRIRQEINGRSLVLTPDFNSLEKIE